MLRVTHSTPRLGDYELDVGSEPFRPTAHAKMVSRMELFPREGYQLDGAIRSDKIAVGSCGGCWGRWQYRPVQEPNGTLPRAPRTRNVPNSRQPGILKAIKGHHWA